MGGADAVRTETAVIDRGDSARGAPRGKQQRQSRHSAISNLASMIVRVYALLGFVKGSSNAGRGCPDVLGLRGRHAARFSAPGEEPGPCVALPGATVQAGIFPFESPGAT